MRPWWDNTWLWSGISITLFAAIAALVVVIFIAMITRDRWRPRS